MADLSASFPFVTTKALALDLASPSSIRAAAAEMLGWKEVDAIDVLINNAGVMSLGSERVVTAEGLELHFATNHLGHFLLTNLIMSKLVAAAERSFHRARVISVSSNAHLASPIRFHDVNFDQVASDLPEAERPILQWLKTFGVVAPDAAGLKGAYDPFVAYAQSKTANVLFSVALAQRMQGKVVALSLNPGAIVTNLQRSTDPEAVKRSQRLMYWKTHGQGAATQMVAAFDPGMDGESLSPFIRAIRSRYQIELKEGGADNIWVEHNGAYLENCQVVTAAPFAADKETAKRLWAMSEKLVGQEFA